MNEEPKTEVHYRVVNVHKNTENKETIVNNKNNISSEDEKETQVLVTETTNNNNNNNGLPFYQNLILAGTYVGSSVIFLLAIKMNNNNNQKKQQPIENNNNNNETSNKSNNNSYGGPLFVICIAFIKLLVTVVVKYAQDGENLLDTVFGFILVFLKNIFMKNNNNHHHNHYQKYKEVWKQGFLFATSSLLYTLYDNLTFINLLHINPGIYSIFMQSRILMTAFLHKLVFQSSIPMQKWFALSLLTFGVVLKYIFNLQESENSKNENVTWWVIFFILLQSFLSVCAGLYNEYLFKKNMNISIHLQNFFMYLFAILFNFFIYVVKNHNNHNKNNNEMIKNAENNNNNNNWGNYTIVVMSGAVMGLSAAFILKFIDIIVKSIASAVEIIIISFLSHVLFGEKFSFLDFVSACMVGTAVYLYAVKR